MKKSRAALSVLMALTLFLVGCDVKKSADTAQKTSSEASDVSIGAEESSEPVSAEVSSVAAASVGESSVASSEKSSTVSVAVSSKASKKSEPKSSVKPKTSSSTVSKSSLPGSAALKKGMTDAEYKQAYDIALGIVNRHKGKEELDMLSGIMDEINSIYNSGTHSEKDAHYNNVYGVFVLKRASCAGVTRAVCLCMTILGISYEHVNENQWTHQWCRAFVKSENAYYILDAQGGYMGEEVKPYEHPMIHGF